VSRTFLQCGVRILVEHAVDILLRNACGVRNLTCSGLVPATRQRSSDARNVLSQRHRRQLAPRLTRRFRTYAAGGNPQSIRARTP